MTQNIMRGRRARLSLSFLLALGLILSLAPAGLAATPPVPGDTPAASVAEPAFDGGTDGKWVQPTRSLEWPIPDAASMTGSAASPAGPAAPAATSPLVMCSATGSDVSITSGTSASVVECSLIAPQDGSIYVAANATASAQSGDAEGAFRIVVDGANWPYDRAVSVYSDPTRVRNKVATINGLQPIGAGAHTVRFEARRSDGGGTLRLTLPSITAIFVPNTGTFRTCNNAIEGTWNTTSTSSLPVVACNLTAPTSGYLFFAVNGWLTATDGSYEAFYRVQHDATLPPTTDDVTYRYQDVYTDYYGGGDDTFTVTGIRWVDAGTRTTTLRVGKIGSGGPGTVALKDPNVMAFFFSPGEALADVCYDQPSESWFTWLQDFRGARGCEMDLSRSSQVFMSADGYSGRYVQSPGYEYPVGPYEMGARLGIGPASGLPDTQRQLNVIEDGLDMSDMGFANAAVRTVTSGLHQFRWSGALISNPANGTAAVYRVGLIAIAIPVSTANDKHVFLPMLYR